jgi:hypothetical protein
MQHLDGVVTLQVGTGDENLRARAAADEMLVRGDPVSAIDPADEASQSLAPVPAMIRSLSAILRSVAVAFSSPRRCLNTLTATGCVCIA